MPKKSLKVDIVDLCPDCHGDLSVVYPATGLAYYRCKECRLILKKCYACGERRMVEKDRRQNGGRTWFECSSCKATTKMNDLADRAFSEFEAERENYSKRSPMQFLSEQAYYAEPLPEMPAVKREPKPKVPVVRTKTIRKITLD